MPELPEVQTVVDDLIRAGIVGCSLTRATVRWPRTISRPAPELFCRLVRGREILSIHRRAKFIVFILAGGYFMAVHLRMTGRFELRADRKAPGKHVHVILALDDGRNLQFHDTRKFGRFYLLENLGMDHFFGALGPEPLAPDFTARRLAGMLAGKRRHIKPLLLDQTFIAGMGNIYVDEALWTARIHPLRRANALKPKEISSLQRAIRKVLKQGLRNAGTTLGRGVANFYSVSRGRGLNATELMVFRRDGQACRRCGATVEHLVVAQRSTHICPRCQSPHPPE
jgi:formamidopyrimidine-DNA glycosylase